jgi:type IV pilus biogenesis protein PilP
MRNSMRNNIKHIRTALLAAAITACTAGPAFAGSAADSLAKIEEETLILKAREKQLGVKAQIIAKEAEIASRQAEVSRTLPPDDDDAPVVQSIEGIGEKLFATLQLRGGGAIDVASGDVLPNGMKVISIRTNEVTVATAKGRRIRLATGAPETTVNAAVTQRRRPSYPSLPPPLPGSSMPFANGGMR